MNFHAVEESFNDDHALALPYPVQIKNFERLSKSGWQFVLRFAVVDGSSRYTHRVAISNHRLIAFENDQVTFRWKDYAHRNKKRKMTVSADEFLRRFLLHLLPRGFVRASARRGDVCLAVFERRYSAIPPLQTTSLRACRCNSSRPGFIPDRALRLEIPSSPTKNAIEIP